MSNPQSAMFGTDKQVPKTACLIVCVRVPIEAAKCNNLI